MSALQKKLLLALSFALLMQAGVTLARYMHDLGGQDFGGDFICFWQAAVHARHGEFAAIYQPELWRQALASPSEQALAWFVYPPFSLFGLQLLGDLNYVQAVTWWSLAPLPAYFALVAAHGRRSEKGLQPQGAATRLGWTGCAALAGLTLPFVSANIFSGQTGAFLAVVFLGFAYCWRDRPLLAGVLIGLLAVKPQLGLLAPLALVAAGRWRTMAAAAATVGALVAGSALWFGPGVWSDYLQMSQLFGQYHGQGASHVGQLAVAPYVALRAAGLPGSAAMGVQALVSLAAAVLILGVFRVEGRERDRRLDLRLGMLAAGSLLATPYALSYDMPLLALALSPLFVRAWRRGWDGWELAALTAAVAAPYAQILLIDHGVPFGLIALLLVFAALVRRYRLETSMASPAWACICSAGKKLSSGTVSGRT